MQAVLSSKTYVYKLLKNSNEKIEYGLDRGMVAPKYISPIIKVINKGLVMDIDRPNRNLLEIRHQGGKLGFFPTINHYNHLAVVWAKYPALLAIYHLEYVEKAETLKIVEDLPTNGKC